MPALIVPCPHCTKPSQLDSDQLPDQPAYFPCPHCQAKVIVDKRELMARQAAANQAPPARPEAATPLRVVSTAPSDRRFAQLPTDARFPGGIICGDGEKNIETIRARMSDLGCELERIESAEAARRMIISEQPELCVYVGGDVSEPPFDGIQPLTSLPPAPRRRLFFVLVADNVKTLDGTAAFLYQANLIVNTEDLPHFAEALHSGLEYHHRLYAQYFAIKEAEGAI